MIFEHKTIKMCVDVANDIEKEINTEMGFFVFDKVRKILRAEKEKTIASIEVDKLTAHALIYLITGNVVYDEIMTGNYHVHRGTLSMLGQNLREIWDKIRSGTIHYGLQTVNEFDEDTRRLDEEISLMG
jgi:hypothetical protein